MPLFSTACAARAWSRLGDFLTFGWVKEWQDLVGGMFALAGAGLGAYYLNRQNLQTREIEEARRTRRMAANRAVLPLTLSAICDYAEQSSNLLVSSLYHCSGGSLPATFSLPEFPSPPTDTIRMLADFIEHSSSDTFVLEDLLRGIQLQDARLSALEADKRRYGELSEAELRGMVLDCAINYA